jgi:hypothetical protein
MSDPIPRPPSPKVMEVRLEVFRPKAATSAIVRFLQDGYGGLFSHWSGGRTWYCDPGACAPQLHKTPRSYRGYCPAEVRFTGKNLWYPYCFEISEHLDQDLAGHKLRGIIWRISKGPKTATGKSPVTAEVLEEVDQAGLPEPFDVTACICNLYHVALVDLSAVNPFRNRPMALPTPGQPPRCELDRAAQIDSYNRAKFTPANGDSQPRKAGSQ